jgi:spermidine/putrescine-binding protein
MSRRSVLVGASGLAALAAMAAAGGRPSWAAEEVRWFTWGTYYSEHYLEGFKEATGVDVSVGSITSNDEEYAMLKAGGTSDWDVWDAENAMCQLHIKDGLVKPLDVSRIPNFEMTFPSLREAEWIMGPDGKHYFVVHIFGIDTICYRIAAVDKPTSWNDLFNPAYKGRVTMQDYALDGINIAGLALFGRDNFSAWTADQMTAITEALTKQKELIRSYWASEADARNLFLNNEVDIGTTWVPTARALQQEGVEVELIIPREGAMGWSDNLGISKDVTPEQEEAAYQLINFLLGEQYGLKINREAPYTTGTTYGWLDKLSTEEKSSLFLDETELLGLSNYRKLPPNYDEWTQLWDEIKLS